MTVATRTLRRIRDVCVAVALLLLVFNALGGFSLGTWLKLNAITFFASILFAVWVQLRRAAGPEPLGPGWADRPPDGAERVPPRIG